MGEDKSGLMIDGHQLWEHQARLLEAVGADAVVVSGRKEGPWWGGRYRAVTDGCGRIGPIGGIFSVMQELQPARIMVLAVDMPRMSAGFLLRLLDRASECGVGVVPRVDGHWEPLAAVYPQCLLPLLREHIEASNFELQKLVDEGIRRRLLVALECPEQEARSWFLNVNTRRDWQNYIQKSQN
jgi:molybdopterin-guanine dinucleotide biosynthesis protein A